MWVDNGQVWVARQNANLRTQSRHRIGLLIKFISAIDLESTLNVFVKYNDEILEAYLVKVFSFLNVECEIFGKFTAFFVRY